MTTAKVTPDNATAPTRNASTPTQAELPSDVTKHAVDLTNTSNQAPYSVRVVIQGLPPTSNGSHGHWRAKHARVKLWKARVFKATWHLRPSVPLKKARLKLTRFSSGQCDYDNLVHSFKCVIDGLREAGILSDDKLINIGVPTYGQEKTNPRGGKIVIEIESLPAHGPEEERNG
jgi:Holliday junction resolvase RusA-like endonuclease